MGSGLSCRALLGTQGHITVANPSSAMMEGTVFWVATQQGVMSFITETEQLYCLTPSTDCASPHCGIGCAVNDPSATADWWNKFAIDASWCTVLQATHWRSMR
eukprot:GHUV01049575.1.p1 GENE.GHUV01049575.1~~GHUV01049575.1.p1  ORF type:complete len:103 (-),score=8.83 GHUV01049575.1:85-393(-)